MTVAFLILYYWAEKSTVIVQTPNYNLKIAAARTMEKAEKALCDYRLPSFNTNGNKSRSDALVFTLLGEKDSPITTDVGNIDEKITVLNPNFAAAVTDMLLEAGVNKGDTVAVLLTGGMPGANLAGYSTAAALNLHVVAITSVGASRWGANSPDFTWLDMEHVLNEQQVFLYHSIAASFGGSDDEGGVRLSEQGRQMISDAVDRNGVTLIHQGSLAENIRARMAVFKNNAPLSSYKAVINVSGGIAALGSPENGRLIPTGVSKRLPPKNYPALGVIHEMNNAGVTVIHIYNIAEGDTSIAHLYKLPVAELPLPKVGEGKLYQHTQYNVTVAAVALALSFIILVLVKYFDRKAFQWREEHTDPDTIV
jgi:poly-gamma-glutamate system protein